MSVRIHGKDYKTVAERVSEVHEKHPGEVQILTELVKWEEGRIIMKASVFIGGNQFEGYAYEDENSSQINRTSALENCETSAIGRALAAAGFGGTEYASANEVENAIHQQGQQTPEREGRMSEPATEKQRGLIWHLSAEKLPGGDDEGRKAYLEGLLREDSPCPVIADNLSALTKAEASAMIEYLQSVV